MEVPAAAAAATAASSPLLELPSAVLLLIAGRASDRSVGRLAQSSRIFRHELRAELATKRIPHDARMARRSSIRHAMLLYGPCPFQAVGGQRMRCVGCGIIICASAEELAAEPQGRQGVALLINMLHHAQLMHSAEYGQLLSLFDKLAQECAR